VYGAIKSAKNITAYSSNKIIKAVFENLSLSILFSSSILKLPLIL
jgi:hypothetical protein